MKSRNDQVDEIVEKIEAMHSYDQPAVAVMPIEKANKSFTNWANSVIDVVVLGCSQVVRQRFLIPPREGSNPSTPAILKWV
ncbi:cation tolerance protein [Trichonephila inaurata madagascariensis]|uniref:Cation tolerance protein n=1 Tax=Trichonephila inaurata madagascariensis TaxID=2747483 RepID=A0A8X7CDM4_9ARAC|nr:cation tolerance protein [Trichonephila inaurata madagascariensis]GFY65418.1 cation tolerance protein [Trichonephila inaurata madagascariensis]